MVGISCTGSIILEITYDLYLLYYILQPIKDKDRRDLDLITNPKDAVKHKVRFVNSFRINSISSLSETILR